MLVARQRKELSGVAKVENAESEVGSRLRAGART